MAFNLASFSVDGLIHLLKNKIKDHGSDGPDQSSSQSNQQTWEEPFLDDNFSRKSDRGPGMPSTSGIDTELSSEEEIARLLNCDDHYSALGLTRYETIDPSFLKKEYRRKVSFHFFGISLFGNDDMVSFDWAPGNACSSRQEHGE